MSKRNLQRLLDLLLEFSETTDPSEGALRDEVSRVRSAIWDRLEG
jgi:hypothetical protein